MVTKKAAATSARTSPGNAGKATEDSVARSRSAATVDKAPSKDDLDLRDMLKSGPRRPAGPVLVGDTMSKSAMDALRNQVLPTATEPSSPKARK